MDMFLQGCDHAQKRHLSFPKTTLSILRLSARASHGSPDRVSRHRRRREGLSPPLSAMVGRLVLKPTQRVRDNAPKNESLHFIAGAIGSDADRWRLRHPRDGRPRGNADK